MDATSGKKALTEREGGSNCKQIDFYAFLLSIVKIFLKMPKQLCFLKLLWKAGGFWVEKWKFLGWKMEILNELGWL